MLLTLLETSWILRVSERTARRMAMRGDIRATRVGAQIRVPLDQFSDFVNVEEVKAEIKRRADAAGVNAHTPASQLPRPTASVDAEAQPDEGEA